MYFEFVCKCLLQQVFVFCILHTFVPRKGYVNNAEQRKFPVTYAGFSKEGVRKLQNNEDQKKNFSAQNQFGFLLKIR